MLTLLPASPKNGGAGRGEFALVIVLNFSIRVKSDAN